MKRDLLPKQIDHVKAPPIKCQGIKTKLVSFIADNIQWNGEGKWIEPFLGSGVICFNLQPDRALLTDTNQHIIKFYQDIQLGKVNEQIARDYLEELGASLYEKGGDFYYQIREEFNENGGSLPFLFLNRASFNGLMRFNSKGKFNVPFGKKVERFRKAYITKICNQIKWVRLVMMDKDWHFRVANFQEGLSCAIKGDFAYMDPPYVGRHTDYFNSWSEQEAIALAQKAQSLPCGFALSMWKENKYRANDHIVDYWGKQSIRTFSHFYHVGSTESLRNKMTEALVIRNGFETHASLPKDYTNRPSPQQATFFK